MVHGARDMQVPIIMPVQTQSTVLVSRVVGEHLKREIQELEVEGWEPG